jgi:5,5'-dehydrodivanillate O-demethylase
MAAHARTTNKETIVDQANGVKKSNVTDFASAGPGTPGGVMLRKYWQPVHLSRDLKNGEVKPIHILGERFTLYRGEGGAAHVVGYRCAHRQTQLSTGWVRGDSIQCYYHGWAYNGAGECVERPGEQPSGPCAAANIDAWPTREHMGVIYAYFGEGAEPEFPPFPHFGDGGVIENSVHHFPCNWFQTYENQIDEVHIAFVHSHSGSHRNLGREIELPQTKAYETDFGMVRETQSPGSDLRTTLYLMPNTMRIIIPTFDDLKAIGGWRDSYLTLVPTDDENHILFMTQHASVAPDEMAAYHEMWNKFQQRVAAEREPREVGQDILDGKLTFNDVLDHPLLLVIEDIVAQTGQMAIADRSKEILGRTDVGVVRMRRVFERELHAIAEGQASKTWRYDGLPPRQGF